MVTFSGFFYYSYLIYSYLEHIKEEYNWERKDILQVTLGGCTVSDSEAVKQMVPNKENIPLHFIEHVYCTEMEIYL